MYFFVQQAVGAAKPESLTLSEKSMISKNDMRFTVSLFSFRVSAEFGVCSKNNLASGQSEIFNLLVIYRFIAVISGARGGGAISS